MVPFHLPARRTAWMCRRNKAGLRLTMHAIFPLRPAATSAPAGKERDVCAEVALPPQAGTKHRRGKKNQVGTETPRVPSEKDANNITNENANMNSARDTEGTEDTEDQVDIPPGSEPLPEDGLGFVDAIHEHVDLYLACARLVRSKDQKISQRMVERLLEMSYGKSPSVPEDQAPQIIFDAPRPNRD
jgi:hypothetical protein